KRVPNYFIAGVTLFDVNTGWLTIPCPGGTFTLLIRNHRQVPCKQPFPTQRLSQLSFAFLGMNSYSGCEPIPPRDFHS
ncbi:MAG TPA: hypothetical protein VJ124_16320, partial [Pyrinomonadaceae bacterium]|nr:hypothetical protein [Pyrinomonadaceae bacterium]